MVSKHYLRSSNHCHSKPPFTTAFWTGTTKPVVMGYTSVPVLINRQWLEISLLVRDTSRKCPVEPTLLDLCTNWQCSLDKHCRFLVQAGSVLSTNTAGLWLKRAVFSWPTLSWYQFLYLWKNNHRICRLSYTDTHILWKIITIYVGYHI